MPNNPAHMLQDKINYLSSPEFKGSQLHFPIIPKPSWLDILNLQECGNYYIDNTTISIMNEIIKRAEKVTVYGLTTFCDEDNKWVYEDGHIEQTIIVNLFEYSPPNQTHYFEGIDEDDEIKRIWLEDAFSFRIVQLFDKPKNIVRYQPCSSQ